MKILLSVLCTVGTLSLHAQKITVNWGEESRKETNFSGLVRGEKNDFIKLSIEAQGGMFFSKRTITPILTRYDKSLNEQNTREYEVSDNDVQFQGLLSVKEKIYLLTSQYNRSNKATTYYAQSVNPKTLSSVGPNQNLGSFEAINRSKQSVVGVELSRDSSHLVLFGLSPYSKKDNEKYYMAVYDGNMKKGWDNTVTLPYKDKFIQVLDYLVTNDGEVGVVLKHYDKEVSREAVSSDGGKVPSYTAKLLLYAKGATTPKEYILQLNDKFVHNLQLTNDAQNNLQLFGLYKNKYDGYVNGYFLCNIERQTQKVTVSRMDAFPEDLVHLVKGDKQGSDKERDPGFSSHFKLDQVIQRPNGTTDYILQYYKAVYHPGTTTFVNGRSSTTPSYWMYYYGDIIDINIVSQNKTVITRIPKLQISRNMTIYSGFKAIGYKDKLLCFYNDDRDNIERDLAKRPDDMIKFDKSMLVMAVVDANGKIERKEVLNHRDMKLTTCVNVSSTLEHDKIGLYAQKNGGLFSAAKDMVGTLDIK